MFEQSGEQIVVGMLIGMVAARPIAWAIDKALSIWPWYRDLDREPAP